jgi:MCP family monocarboxylic acid transporter-like MFS transporter 14
MFFFPLCNSFGLYAFLAALYGFFTTFFVLKTIVLVELLGIENLTSAFSLLQLFEGIASIIGPTVAGELYEATGQSYDITFYVAGTFFLLAGLISVGAQILHWKTRKQQ